MPKLLSKEVRQLQQNWQNGASAQWPKRLEWLEIKGIRGWTGQRVAMPFPIVAICGENGVGKSTVLQSSVSAYKAPAGQSSYYASQFFPDTPWDAVKDAAIRYSVREGASSRDGSVRKPTQRWLGNPDRRERPSIYVDLRRAQPVVAQRGYQRIIKKGVKQAGFDAIKPDDLTRYSAILGRNYVSAKRAWSTAGDKLKVAVVGVQGAEYSGFHQGAGESTVSEILSLSVARYSLIAIDEIETSLHPRAQRRLVRDLAKLARLHELQILLTTHSPYVLEELPPEARLYVAGSPRARTVVQGISPEFALTNMDDDSHPEADLFVEDAEAAIFVREVLIRENPDLARRVAIVPAGAASVVRALGEMVDRGAFPRPTAAILDGEQNASRGCIVLPGGDAPERVVLEDLDKAGFPQVAQALSRKHVDLTDATQAALTLEDHHEWIPAICEKLLTSRSEFWCVAVRAWAKSCAQPEALKKVVESIAQTLDLPASAVGVNGPA